MTPRPRAPAADASRLIGGRVCLDFVNTVAWRDTAAPADRLPTYGDLLQWAVRAGVTTAGERRVLARRAAREPASAAAALRAARRLREVVCRIVLAWRRGRDPASGDLAAFNRALAAAPPRRRLAARRGDLTWRGSPAPDDLRRPLWPIVWSAADLLTGGDPRRVGVCAGDGCGWIFYDESRAGRRRWCSMEECGNRAKARRHYARVTGRAARG